MRITRFDSSFLFSVQRTFCLPTFLFLEQIHVDKSTTIAIRTSDSVLRIAGQLKTKPSRFTVKEITLKDLLAARQAALVCLFRLRFLFFPHKKKKQRPFLQLFSPWLHRTMRLAYAAAVFVSGARCLEL